MSHHIPLFPFSSRRPVTSLTVSRPQRTLLLGVMLSLGAGSGMGCVYAGGDPPPAKIKKPNLTRIAEVEAHVAPPKGWKAKPIEKGSQHREAAWVSPSGKVSYGVIRFDMPFPAPSDMVISGYVNDIAKTEGSAELLSKIKSPTNTRFLVAGAKQTADVRLILRGTKGWFIYYRTPSPPYTDQNPKASIPEVGDAITARDTTEVDE